MLEGVLPVLATPFAASGEVDHASLRRLVGYALEAQADGVVFPGVASEFDFLSAAERTSALEVIVEAVGGRIPIIVGASAPTAAEAGALAREGAMLGAAAAMVMAPAAIGSEVDALVPFLAAVAETAGIPIVLQNAPPPIGAGLPVETTLAVAARVPAIRFVKEETLPCAQRITRLIAGAPATLLGGIGGAGGRYIVDELNRGAAGTMPAAELTEAHVAIVRAHRGGDHRIARGIFNRTLPLLSFQAVFRMRMTKAVLVARGIFATELCRAPGPDLDAGDRRELRAMLDEMADLLTVCPPTPAAVCGNIA
jgi:4-hydroxy-tetrahydrodipicolinate synthase